MKSVPISNTQAYYNGSELPISYQWWLLLDQSAGSTRVKLRSCIRNRMHRCLFAHNSLRTPHAASDGEAKRGFHIELAYTGKNSEASAAQ